MKRQLSGALALVPLLLAAQSIAVFAAGASDPSPFAPLPEQDSWAGPAHRTNCNAQVTLDQRITACTHVIQDRTETAGNRAIAYVTRGVAYKDNKDFERAIADFDEAIKLDPSQVTAYNNRGLVYYKKKDYERAIGDLGEAIKLNPKNSWAYGQRGQAQLDKGDHDRAIADLSEAVRIDPRYAWAYGQRGRAYYDKEENTVLETLPLERFCGLARSGERHLAARNIQKLGMAQKYWFVDWSWNTGPEHESGFDVGPVMRQTARASLQLISCPPRVRHVGSLSPL